MKHLTNTDQITKPGSIGWLNRFIRRLSVKGFATFGWAITPAIVCGYEPGCWGYPGCHWISFEWMKWHLQIGLYNYPCEHCLLFKQPTPDQ